MIDGYDPAWTEGFFQAINGTSSGSNFIMPTDTPCERPKNLGNVTLKIETTGANSTLDIPGKKILRASWSGDRMIKNITIHEGDEVRSSTEFSSGAKMTGEVRFSQELGIGDHIFHITAIDIYGFSYEQDITITIGGSPLENG